MPELPDPSQVIPSQPAFHVEPLGDHDRASFSCGVEPLDRYLREQAGQDARKHAAAPFVLVTPVRFTTSLMMSSLIKRSAPALQIENQGLTH